MVRKTNKSSLNSNVNMKSWQLLVFVVAFAALGTALVLQTFAAPPTDKGGKGGKPSGGGSSTLTYTVTQDANADGQPNYGDSIVFTVSTTATTEPHVEVSCLQDGQVVYTAQTGYFEGYPWPWTQTFTLKSGAWLSGGADCTAKSYYFDGRKTPILNTIAFTVNP